MKKILCLLLVSYLNAGSVETFAEKLDAKSPMKKRAENILVVASPDSTAETQGSLSAARKTKNKNKNKAATRRKINSFNKFNKNAVKTFFAYENNFAGGVRVAVGDLNADGTAEIITAPGAGRSPLIKIFNPKNGRPASLLPFVEFEAFQPAFTDGLFVAIGNVSPGHGTSIIAGAGSTPFISVIHPLENRQLTGFFAYDQSFSGGVRVAAGDVISDADGLEEIITGPGPGGSPVVRIFNAPNNRLLNSFSAYDTGFTGGIYVAAGDVNGDGQTDIITGAGETPSGSTGGGPHVKVFSGSGAQQLDFFAYETSFQGGVRVAAGDVNGDGIADIITGAGPGSGPVVKAFSGTDGKLISSFSAYDSKFRGGIFVSAE